MNQNLLSFILKLYKNEQKCLGLFFFKIFNVSCNVYCFLSNFSYTLLGRGIQLSVYLSAIAHFAPLNMPSCSP